MKPKPLSTLKALTEPPTLPAGKTAGVLTAAGVAIQGKADCAPAAGGVSPCTIPIGLDGGRPAATPVTRRGSVYAPVTSCATGFILAGSKEGLKMTRPPTASALPSCNDEACTKKSSPPPSGAMKP